LQANFFGALSNLDLKPYLISTRSFNATADKNKNQQKQKCGCQNRQPPRLKNKESYDQNL
jgi:hypothetical protein